MARSGNERNVHYMKLGYGAVTIFGILLIILQFSNVPKLQRYSDSNIPGAEDKEDSCQPRTNIMFLKTHNILFRYGDYRNLTFALPKSKRNYDYPNVFSTSSVFGFSPNIREDYNIMCHHMRFSLAEVEKVMPSDTFYFTILRNPVTLMESSFAYYKNSFSRVRNLEMFLNNPFRFYQKESYDSGYAKNLMTFDLGFNHNGPEMLKQITFLCQEVEAMFDLVLITEYFDESLVLLRHALCWGLDDVLSVPLNARSDRSRRVLSFQYRERIKRWNQLDWKLYNYFNNSFWNRVEKFGKERMEKEVEELRKRRTQLSEKCLDNLVDPNQLRDKLMIPYQPRSAIILGYNLKPGLTKYDEELCKRFVLPEPQYTELLWTKQAKSKSLRRRHIQAPTLHFRN